MPSLGGRWLRREAEQTDEGMEHSSKCNVVRNCSPALIRLASLGTFPGGEGFGAILRRSSAERRCAERRDLSGGRDECDGQLMAEIF